LKTQNCLNRPFEALRDHLKAQKGIKRPFEGSKGH
jgi:hypothetical protein